MNTTDWEARYHDLNREHVAMMRLWQEEERRANDALNEMMRERDEARAALNARNLNENGDT